MRSPLPFTYILLHYAAAFGDQHFQTSSVASAGSLFQGASAQHHTGGCQLAGALSLGV